MDHVPTSSAVPQGCSALVLPAKLPTVQIRATGHPHLRAAVTQLQLSYHGCCQLMIKLIKRSKLPQTCKFFHRISSSASFPGGSSSREGQTSRWVLVQDPSTCTSKGSSELNCRTREESTINQEKLSLCAFSPLFSGGWELWLAPSWEPVARANRGCGDKAQVTPATGDGQGEGTVKGQSTWGV